MKKSTIKIIQFIMFSFLIYFILKKAPLIEGFSIEEKQALFDDFLENHYRNIFPDGRRNSGGPMFYHYFVNNMDLDREHFILYNQFYCGVSGSIVSPNRSGGNITNHIVLKDLEDNEWFGKYYRCCVPCLCDLMRYTKVERHTVQLSDGPYEHFVITMDDPCINPSNIPGEVSSYQCSGGTTQNGVHAASGRLIVAVLFGNHEMTEQPVPYDPNTHTIDGDQFCEQRICQAPNQLRGGMGDIFVQLSLVGNSEIPQPPDRFSCLEPMNNNSDTHSDMVNIFGEPLRKCRSEENSSDTRGSWDSQGFCSELGGGVHQICFSVDENTRDFARDTDQGGNWTIDRENKNHCMCIGAWALYKAKQAEGMINETYDELQCDAIPKVALTDTYLNTWATWNGNELSGQIIHGVNKLVEQCHEKAENDSHKSHLRDLYMDLVNNHPEFVDNVLSLNQR